MATIPKALLDDLTRRVNTLSAATRKVAYRRLMAIEWESIADLRNKIIEALRPLIGAASADAAAYAAQFYDDYREQAIGSPIGAVADPMWDEEATEQAVRAIMEKMVRTGVFESIINDLLNRVDYDIKRAAGECVKENAWRDPASRRWARVPTGAETCGFCLMLASRGFSYMSERSAGGDGHYHANCDCRIVPGFDDTEVEGYDEMELYRKWVESGHAEYMNRYNEKKRLEGRHSNDSIYAIKAADGLPGFKNFNDVKQFLYDAETQGDLEHRFQILLNVYGTRSKQIGSVALKNVVKTASKAIDKRNAE